MSGAALILDADLVRRQNSALRAAMNLRERVERGESLAWRVSRPRDYLEDAVARAVDDLNRREARAVADRVWAEQTQNGSVGWHHLRDAVGFLYPPDADREVALLGGGTEVLHMGGEATLVCSMTGVGKSTLAQNYVAHRLDLEGFDGTLLGLPVHPLGPGETILYVAADRPTQIRRSLRRLVGPDPAAALGNRLLVWWGPPSFRLNDRPGALLEFVRAVERQRGIRVAEVILDSLKDLAFDLHKPEGAGRAGDAIKTTVAEGIDLLVLHHDRKAEAGTKRSAKNISVDDIYGGMQLAGGAGNVAYLLGQPGGETAELLHLKPCMEPVGPIGLLLDRASGRVEVGTGPPADSVWRPTGRMEATSKFLEGATDPQPERWIVEGVTGRAERTREAIACLVAEGFVRRWREGRANLHEVVRRYREADDPFDEHGQPKVEFTVVEDDEGGGDRA